MYTPKSKMLIIFILTLELGFLAFILSQFSHFLSELVVLAKTLTTEYSMRAPNTKDRQTDIHTSIAFIYDTRGNLCDVPLLCVVIVNTENSVKIV